MSTDRPWLEVDLGVDVAVKTVRILNRLDTSVSDRLTGARVKLINRYGKEFTKDLGYTWGKSVLEVSFDELWKTELIKFGVNERSWIKIRPRKIRVSTNNTNYFRMREVQVFDQNGVNVALQKKATQSGTSSNPASNAVNGNMTDSGSWSQRDFLVRKVRIHVWENCLQMREVEVYGYNNMTNLALGKNVRQSGTWANNMGDYGAPNARDGNINTISSTLCAGGKFNISACKFLVSCIFHPILSVPFPLCLHIESWWEVDMGVDVAVKTVRILNRLDLPGSGAVGETFSGRLTGAHVELFGSNGNLLISKDLGNTQGKSVLDVSFDERK